MRRSVWALSVVALGACARVEPGADGHETKAQAIQYGATDTESRFAVGVCRTRTEPGRCNGLCSGALILPNVVATARHCVEQSVTRVDCRTAPRFGAAKEGALYVTTRTTMSDTTREAWHAVTTVYTPKDDHVCGNDIALLVLDAPVPTAEAKPITPNVRYAMWDRERYEDVFTAIGYGTTSPEGGGSGVRRKLELVSVLCVPGSPAIPCPEGFDAREFAGGDGTCSGDSGSSAFERSAFERGDPVSFGVLSRGSISDDATECVSSVYTRFDAHRDFVVDVAREASRGFTLYEEPAWTAARAAPVSAVGDAGTAAPCADRCPAGATCRANACVPSAAEVAPTRSAEPQGGCQAGTASARFTWISMLLPLVVWARRRRPAHP